MKTKIRAVLLKKKKLKQSDKKATQEATQEQTISLSRQVFPTLHWRPATSFRPEAPVSVEMPELEPELFCMQNKCITM